jgi:tyrosine-protein phosphatase YwqE
MQKHYQEVVDEIFGSTYRHRTLRTIFDSKSYEWHETTVEEKLEILKKLIESRKISLEEITLGYKIFYQTEIANKRQVINTLQDALIILLKYSIK